MRICTLSFAVLTLALTASLRAQDCVGAWRGGGFQSAPQAAQVLGLAQLSNGDLVAGGIFQTLNGFTYFNHIARRTGPDWLPIGTGMNGHVYCILPLSDGRFVAAGAFTRAGNVQANHIALWNGTTWEALGGGANGDVLCLATTQNGEIIAGGSFSSAEGRPGTRFLAKWNGATWTAFAPELNNEPKSIVVLPNGHVMVAGLMDRAGTATVSRVAYWNGVDWFAMGDPRAMAGFVDAACLLNDGRPAIGGLFTVAEYGQYFQVAAWNGDAWQPLAGPATTGGVKALKALPTGQLIATGDFLHLGGVAANRVALWDRGAWTPLGAGLDDSAACVAVTGPASVAMGGRFQLANGVPSVRVAEWHQPAAPRQVGVTPVGPVAICEGRPLELLAQAMAQPAPAYQWRRNGVDLAGQTSRSLLIPAVTAQDEGLYTCLVSNPCGTAVSSTIEVAVLTSPRISSQPQSQVVASGSNIMFVTGITLPAWCTSTPTYQWQKRNAAVEDPEANEAWMNLADGPDFVGSRSPSFGILNARAALATGYRCVVTITCACDSDSPLVLISESANFDITCPADFNADGGIDFTDVEAFFERWENGC